ncbi:MAG TPA: G1 family glutamic endopeptidase [Streptosporangiaceae bacterium]|nr:G1 family glutamic endopeptidase [Streptosporangiaceae bacterium]
MTLARLRRPALAVTFGAAAVAVPLLSLAAPAQAAAPVNGGGRWIAAANSTAPSVINSTNTAGYLASVTRGSATSSATRFTVPRISCTHTPVDRAITIEARVQVNNGSSFSAAVLFAGCSAGSAAYFPALIINGNEVNYNTSARPGDLIEVSVKVTTTGTTVQVTDVTTHVTKKRTGPGARSSDAFIGNFGVRTSNGTHLGVPAFGTIIFANCLVDGRALARSHPLRVQRVTGRTVQIATGPLSPRGLVFATHYKHF